MVKEIRWEFSRGESRAEMTRRLQEKGLKLEFIDSLISRAKRPRRILKMVIFSIVLFLLMWTSVYALFFYHTTEKSNYSPLWIQKNIDSAEMSLKITPELISLVASEMGATKLRRNPINLKMPIINFQISEKNFYSIIDKRIETFEGKSEEADIIFYSETEVIEQILGTDDFKEELKKRIVNGDIRIEKRSSDRDLFLKGYLVLYKELEGL